MKTETLIAVDLRYHEERIHLLERHVNYHLPMHCGFFGRLRWLLTGRCL